MARCRPDGAIQLDGSHQSQWRSLRSPPDGALQLEECHQAQWHGLPDSTPQTLPAPPTCTASQPIRLSAQCNTRTTCDDDAPSPSRITPRSPPRFLRALFLVLSGSADASRKSKRADGCTGAGSGVPSYLKTDTQPHRRASGAKSSRNKLRRRREK